MYCLAADKLEGYPSTPNFEACSPVERSEIVHLLLSSLDILSR